MRERERVIEELQTQAHRGGGYVNTGLETRFFVPLPGRGVKWCRLTTIEQTVTNHTSWSLVRTSQLQAPPVGADSRVAETAFQLLCDSAHRMQIYSRDRFEH